MEPPCPAMVSNGHIIPVGDVDELAARVRDLALSPDRSKAFGAVGRKQVEDRHALPAVVDQFLKLHRAS